MLSVRLPHSCRRLETAPTASGLRITAQFITQGSPAHDGIANIYISSFCAWLERLEILQGGLEELQLWGMQGGARTGDGSCLKNQLALFQGGKKKAKKNFKSSKSLCSLGSFPALLWKWVCCSAAHNSVRCEGVFLLAEVVKGVLESNWGNFSEEGKVSFVLGVLWGFFHAGSTALTSSTIVSTNMNSYFHREVTYFWKSTLNAEFYIT